MNKRKPMSKEEIELFYKIMEPYNFQKEINRKIDPKMNNIEKNCHTCADYIVCWGMEEVGDRIKENCPDWQIDFMTFQKLLEE